MSILAFAPMHNTPGKRDATGAFQPEARAFVKLHGGIIALIDNHARPLVQRRQVHAAISEVGPSVVAFFCHGWRTGIQFGIGMAHLDALAAAISGASYGPTIALYCCSTGSGPGIGGDGGFADWFRDALCRAGADFCQIDAHTTAGHCTRNPNVRRFEGMGSPTGGVGGYYIVAPKSALWSRWRAALAGDLRLRFPMMSVGEIHRELAAG